MVSFTKDHYNSRPTLLGIWGYNEVFCEIYTSCALPQTNIIENKIFYFNIWKLLLLKIIITDITVKIIFETKLKMKYHYNPHHVYRN